jgi:hypothetical protein
MRIVDAGFDIRRSQITFDALDTETGEMITGRIEASPEAVEEWVERFSDREIHLASRRAPDGSSSPGRWSAPEPSPTWPRSPRPERWAESGAPRPTAPTPAG